MPAGALRGAGAGDWQRQDTITLASKDQLVDTLNLIKLSVEAGDLDKQLETTAAVSSSRFIK